MNDYERLRKAAEYLEEYCVGRECEHCALNHVCGYGAMKLPDFLVDAAESVERPALVAEFASRR